MKSIAFKILSLSLALAASRAAAGVWTSGGSELIKDSANPWFIQNTETVQVCVVYDPEAFHTPTGPGDLQAATDSALAYWKAEFAKSWSVAKLIRVATQNFQMQAPQAITAKSDPAKLCAANTDLTLQFGWLSASQKSWLTEHGHRPGDLVAITVRTDYDALTMRGKGFIFVAGDSGIWALADQDLITSPWKLGKGKLLGEVMKHELGHVFGVPHMGIDSPMAPDYAERILHKGWGESIADLGSDQPFFKIEGPYTLRRQCYPKDSGMRKGWRTFLDAPASHICMLAVLGKDDVSFSTGPDLEHLEARGVLRFVGDERYSWQDAVRVYMPAGQKAMSCPDPSIGAGICPWLVGPMIKIIDRVGEYSSKDGKIKRQVALTLSPLGLGFAQAKFSVEIEGAWHWNLDWEY